MDMQTFAELVRPLAEALKGIRLDDAAQAREAVTAAHLVDQAIGDRFDHHIAVGFAVVVVDIGKLVHVDIKQCGVEAVALGALHGSFQVRAKAHPVQGAGQGVAIRQLLDLVPGELELDAVVENPVHQRILQLPAHQVVPGTFRGGFDQHRGFHLKESFFTHVFPDLYGHAVPQFQVFPDRSEFLQGIGKIILSLQEFHFDSFLGILLVILGLLVSNFFLGDSCLPETTAENGYVERQAHQ